MLGTDHLILLALVTGMRYAELMGLIRDPNNAKKNSFDFKNDKIYIAQTWDYTYGGGFGRLKNDSPPRTIEVDYHVMREFEYMFKKIPIPKNNLVFYCPNKVGCITNDAANQALNRILKKLKIDPVTMHGLRHTHASILLYEKIAIHFVSERLGHGDIRTTYDYYVHVINELRERDGQKSAEIFSKMKKKKNKQPEKT